jgi:hypothetical protein
MERPSTHINATAATGPHASADCPLLEHAQANGATVAAESLPTVTVKLNR